MTHIKLFEIPPARSARCRWALLEAGLEFESVAGGRELFANEELATIHPLKKVPAALIDGQPLFESAAIATAVADLVPEKNLIAKSGTRARMLHDQWAFFAMTELEAFVWSNALNTFVLPEDQRVPEILEQNKMMYRRGASALNEALGQSEYLVENQFSVTDIIVSYAVNWGRRSGFTEGLTNLDAYLDRMFAREHCTLSQD
jgi:glutathione S-transferase